MFICVNRACKRWAKKQNTWQRCYKPSGGTALSPSLCHFSEPHSNFDVLLTVHLSIILAINQLNAQNLLL